MTSSFTGCRDCSPPADTTTRGRLVPCAQLPMIPGDDAGRVKPEPDPLRRLLGNGGFPLERRTGGPAAGIADAEREADGGDRGEIANQLDVALDHGAAELQVPVARLHLERGLRKP